MQKFTQTLRLTAIAMLLLFGVAAVRAQVTITGSINGTVTDSTGGVIPGASVTATELKTNVDTKTTTDKDGLYNLRFLNIGTYKVKFEAKGFGPAETPEFVLEVGQTAKEDASLKVGGANDTVSVTAELQPLLHTEDAVQSTVLDARAIANIPLFGRSLTDLTQFQPGAISTTPNSVGNNVFVNGSRNQGNSYVLNGMETNQNIDYGQTYQPNTDAVEQVQMVASTASAEYGNVEGGQFITVLKSGTNQFHGNAFANLRNYLLDANTWGHKHVTTGPSAFTPRSTYTTYQFGGTLGGPIIKNKLFAFGDYQGYRTHSTSNGTASVPTYNERGCSGGQAGSACTGGTSADFSELLDAHIMCNSSCAGGSAAKGKVIQLFDTQNNFKPVPGNKGVPITNPVAKYLFAHNNLLPLPGSAVGINGVVLSPTGQALDGSGFGVGKLGNGPGSGNISTIQKSSGYTNQYDIKLDYAFSQADRISGSYTHFYNYPNTGTPTILINFPNPSPVTTHIYTLDEIHTFNSALVNDFRAGYQRYITNPFTYLDVSGVFGMNGNSVLGIGSAGGGISQYVNGFTSQSQTSASTMTNIYKQSNAGQEAMGGTTGGGNSQLENTFMYGDTLTWLHGRHDVKFGISIASYQQNNFYPGNDGTLGQITPTGLFYSDKVSDNNPSPINPATLTGNPSDCSITTNPGGPSATAFCNTNGYGYADFVSDRISGTAIGGSSSPYHMRQFRDAYFVQDNWKIRPNLTLNLGLRYEYNTQISETDNRIAAPDILTQTMIIGGTAAAETYCPGCSRTLVHPFYGGILPRVGFSYAITPRFITRAGYSAMQFMEGTGSNLRMVYNPPFQSSSEATANIPDSTGNTGTPYREEDGFNHPGSAPSLTALLWNPHIRPGYVNTFSAGIEYQLNNTSSFALNYVGKTGQHLVSPGYANQLNGPCTDKSFITASDAAGVYTGAANLVTPTSPTTAVCYNNHPAPYEKVPGIGYGGQVKQTNSNAMENDNSLQASFRQRLWHGLQYTYNFTWGHALTNNTGYYNGNAYTQNYYDFHSEYGNSPQDVTLVSNWNMVYDLPFGRGRTFLGKMPIYVDEVIGGWRLSMTGVEQTGISSLTESGQNNVTYMNGSGVNRPNQLRPLIRNGKSMTQWYGNDPSTVLCSGQGAGGAAAPDNGTCAFQQPALGTFGTARPYQLRTPGFQVYNMDLNKDFRIWHEHAINFRADALNVFNQTELGNPSTNVQNNSFGAITGVNSTNRQLQLTASYHF